MDLFEEKNIKPMLIGAGAEAFDSPDYIFELKLDGERCLAYLDASSTELRNKRNVKMLTKVPELSDIHRHIKKRCILDGELLVIKDGKPDFYEIQRRSLMSNPIKIALASKQYPACFTAFDIIYCEDRATNMIPLTERKALLQAVVGDESPGFAVSRFIEERGTAFYNLVQQQELEGIVAKRKDSKYFFGKRTRDWIKIKYLRDEDFVVCGYISADNNMTSVILGQYADRLIYKGHVTLGVGGEARRKIVSLDVIEGPPFEVPPGKEKAVWVEPRLVCTVQYMMKTANGGRRQPVFKGLREDKTASECLTEQP
ncbi:MAG: RNA ligase family protein [Eubacteriales bacterium]|jgi:bifunctional non-homologous end joining protein LigD|nr:RNA ligase family protein [Eubacteriales bacterium]